MKKTIVFSIIFVLLLSTLVLAQLIRFPIGAQQVCHIPVSLTITPAARSNPDGMCKGGELEPTIMTPPAFVNDQDRPITTLRPDGTFDETSRILSCVIPCSASVKQFCLKDLGITPGVPNYAENRVDRSRCTTSFQPPQISPTPTITPTVSSEAICHVPTGTLQISDPDAKFACLEFRVFGKNSVHVDGIQPQDITARVIPATTRTPELLECKLSCNHPKGPEINICRQIDPMNGYVIQPQQVCTPQTTPTQQLPDLTVPQLTATPATPQTGQETTASFTIRNEGTANFAGTVAINLYLDNNLEKTKLSSITLTPGATTSQTWADTKFSFTTAGTHQIKITLSTAVQEITTTNNEHITQVPVTLPPQPDLIITSIIPAPQNPTTNDPLTLTYTVKNIGTAPFTGTANLDLTIDLQSQPNYKTYGPVTEPISLAPNEEKSITWSGIPFTLPAGMHDLKLKITSSTPAENTANNEKKQSITIQAAAAQPTPTPGQWSITPIENVNPSGGTFVPVLLSNSLVARDANNLFIVYSDQSASFGKLKLAKTSDGGQTWSPTTLDSQTGVQSFASLALSSNSIFVSYFDTINKDLKITKSLDNAQTWIPSIVESSGDVGLYSSLVALSPTTLLIAYWDATANALKIKKSTDTGQSWTTSTVDQGFNIRLVSLKAADAQNLFVTYTKDTTMHLAHSNDGGTTWAFKKALGTGATGTLAVSDAQHLFLSYYDSVNDDLKLLVSSDTGRNWQSKSVDSTGNVGGQSSLIALDSQRLFIAYYDNTNQDIKLATTSDGGTNWDLQTVDTNAAGLHQPSLGVINPTFVSYYNSQGHLTFARLSTPTTTQPTQGTTPTPPPNVAPGQPLIVNKPKCGKPFLNVRPNTNQPHALCQPFNIWEFVEDHNETTEKTNPFGSDDANIPFKYSPRCDQAFHKTGCCATTTCWNGKQCQQNGTFFDGETTGFFCNEGTWQKITRKTNFDKTDQGFCERDNQCLVFSHGNKQHNDDPTKFFMHTSRNQWPQCIADKQYLKDEYCNNGNWTTRTKLIATQLISLAETSGVTGYDLFCDSYDNVLNNVDYHYRTGIPDVKVFFQDCAKPMPGGIDKIVPCVNHVCVIKTNRGVEAVGVSLNTPINAEKSFLKALDLDKTNCDNTLTATSFAACAVPQNFRGGVWHHPGIESIIYFPPTLTTDIYDRYTQPPLQGIIEYVHTKHILENPSRNFAFINATSMFNKFMYSRKGSRTIFAFLEKQPSLSTTSQAHYLGIRYANFSLSTDPCLLFKTAFNKASIPEPFCEKQLNPFEFILVTKDQHAPPWRDLTSKLRLIEGPPKQISTDLGPRTPPTPQQQTQPTCP